ncbi:Protein of unknown function [Gryllus bimaculatus]|nr:Protein of unknown function [Gryllus bimaculatus]
MPLPMMAAGVQKALTPPRPLRRPRPAPALSQKERRDGGAIYCAGSFAPCGEERLCWRLNETQLSRRSLLGGPTSLPEPSRGAAPPSASLLHPAAAAAAAAATAAGGGGGSGGVWMVASEAMMLTVVVVVTAAMLTAIGGGVGGDGDGVAWSRQSYEKRKGFEVEGIRVKGVWGAKDVRTKVGAGDVGWRGGGDGVEECEAIAWEKMMLGKNGDGIAVQEMEEKGQWISKTPKQWALLKCGKRERRRTL